MLKNKLRILFMLLPCLGYSILSTDYRFFEKRVNRRYFAEEYIHKVVYKNEMPFRHQSIAPYFFSYEGSPGLKNLKVALTKELIMDKNYETDSLKEEDVLFITFDRENLNKGALEVSTHLKMEKWHRSISFWISDSASGMDAYLYVKHDKYIERYPIGMIDHVGWRNFQVNLKEYPDAKKVEIQKIKLFNRKTKGGLENMNPVIKIGRIEFLSKPFKKKTVKKYIKHIPVSDFIRDTEQEQIYPDRLYVRSKKGISWSPEFTLSLFVEIKKPVYFEVIGSLISFKDYLFSLQSAFYSKPEKFRIDISIPDDLGILFQKRKDEVGLFWGFIITSLEKQRPELVVKEVVMWNSSLFK